MWGKQTYRLSDLDFEANMKDGIGVDWPIRYNDLAPWYDHVETFIGVSGRPEGLPHLPDGKFLPPMDLNCVEEVLRDKVAEKFDGRKITIGRVAHLTAPLAHDPSRGIWGRAVNRALRRRHELALMEERVAHALLELLEVRVARC